jgi:hypothetical protein
LAEISEVERMEERSGLRDERGPKRTCVVSCIRGGDIMLPNARPPAGEVAELPVLRSNIEYDPGVAADVDATGMRSSPPSPIDESMSIVLPFADPFIRESAPRPSGEGSTPYVSVANPFPLSIDDRIAYSRFAASEPNSFE